MSQKAKLNNGKSVTDERFSHIQPKGSWEIPRKLFHYSIGFIVYYLYTHGYDTSDIYPVLTVFLCLVLTGELFRFSMDWFNVLYCRVLGPLMRKTEVASRLNGVVYYLAGCVIVLYAFPKDIASLSIIYLSWTDPTASICGRLWGQYTPRYGNKSLAGSLGAVIVGTLVTYAFFGPCGSDAPSYSHDGPNLVLFSIYGGIVAGVSEAMGDSVGLDDNLTIPVLSAIFLWIPLIGLGLGNA
ncbi:hypothetical protein DFQ28_004991 [Apophysomyces sp. BC1034]|nr:hypothetical protein DFQ30_004938 [Apophysomyces sp. BC1015]KAG0178056.1 hypothetical protein DFQ29_003997 [Apophysomyces sp. BC1021]KAG0188326.1 hypothetical protein DFQ28_004991 [Apophysomyces sp. BC1034]